MSIDLKKTNSKNYWTMVNKLFAICRKKKVNPNEMQLLANYPYLRNKKGQNLIMYALEKSPNLNIVNCLLQYGHNIIKDDIYNIFDTIVRLYKKYEDHIMFIIDYIIQNNMIDNKIITKNILHMINYKTTYKFIKYIIDKNILTKNLGNFNIFRRSTDMNIIKLFNENFIMKECKDYLYQVFIDNKILNNVNDDYIKYLIDNSKIIEQQSLINIINIKTYNCNPHLKSKILRKIYSITKIDDTKFWTEFMDTLMLGEPSINNKTMLYIGLLTGNIKDFPVNLIRGFSMNIQSIKSYSSVNKINSMNKINYWKNTFLWGCINNEKYNIDIHQKLFKKYNINPLYLFREDVKYLYPSLSDNEFNNKDLFKIIGCVNLSKNECIEIKREILNICKSIK
jgi:hypothetical protein